MDLYIYYRVASANAKRLCAQVTAMQAELARELGVVAHLKRRPAEQDGQHTWMEIYANAPADFEAKLDRAVADADLAAVIVGERHTEHFMDASTCA